MATIGNINIPDICPKYNCIFCDYKTSKKSSYDNHVKSNKHKNNLLEAKDNKYNAKICSKKYLCKNCEKEYIDRTGLWRHKKKCNNNKVENIDSENKDEIILNLIKQNNALIEMIKETNSNK
jgi:hypothetical protein